MNFLVEDVKEGVSVENTLTHRVCEAVGNCLVSLRAEAVSADRVAELQTGPLDVRAAATGAAECKHESPFV